ncbi:SLH family protein [Deinococcus aetherius]|uniref:SLH family protein n=1 Tax=Deinococcus aetherius TaxID=200252 RepID=A0ABN6RGN8_9DEIO|nr:S-layer homology domain-containing protein [Deinococcus aetherius]BDP42530.1 SLH family protein [Deinococcus aetherius]
MRKSLIIASTLALSVGAASAQTDQTTTPAAPATQTTPAPTTPATNTTQTTDQTATPAATPAAAPATTTATPSQVTTFSDVPAGHWAKDAVDVIVQRGLIQGFPDGTFRGNESLTRYQAALIFYRLLQNGGLSNSNLSQGDLTTITRGIQEVSTELAALTTRVTDLERLSADQQARITALEGRIAALGTGTGTAGTDTAALTARIDALEAAVRALPTAPAATAGTDTAALTARIDALEAAARNAATTPATTTPAPTTTGTDTTGTVTTTPAPSTVVIGDTAPAATAPTRGNLFAGVSIGAASAGSLGNCYIPNANGRAVNFCASFGGMIGSTQIIGPVGARVAADYRPGANAISADVNATVATTFGRFQPYAGAGLGLTSSRTRATAATPNPTGNSTDTYVSALIGVDFQVTDTISAFAEADARYYLTNKGVGAAQDAAATRGFGNAVKAGLKFYF